MDMLNSRLFEAKAVYWSIRVYNALLDLIAGFMFSALVFQLLGVSLLLAAAPAIIFSAYQAMRQLRGQNLVRQLEGKYDNLDQRLQTAIEYQGTTNVIVEDLMADVTKRMDDVETSTFLNSRALSRRVYAIVVLSFLLLTVTVFDLRSVALRSLDTIFDSSDFADGLKNIAAGAGVGFDVLSGNRWEDSNLSTQDKNKLGANPGGERPGFSEGPIPGKGGGAGSKVGTDLFGDAKSASLNGKDVDFKLHPEYGGDIEIRETSGTGSDKAFKMDDVQSVDECMDCSVGPEHEEVVRKYFEKILPET